MTNALSRNTVLLVVDVQKGFDRLNEKVHCNNPALEANVARLQRAGPFDLQEVGLFAAVAVPLQRPT